MKKLIVTLFGCLLVVSVSAQKIDYRDPAWDQDAKLLVVLTGDEEMDTALKVGFEIFWTYWNYEFVTHEEFKKQTPVIDYRFYLKLEKMVVNKEFTFTRIVLAEKNKNPKKDDFIIFMLHFDDYAPVETGIVQGIDNNSSTRTTKLLAFIKLFNAELFLRKELGPSAYNRNQTDKNAIGKTLLVPKEYFDLDLSETDFKKKCKINYTIMSSEEILKKLVDPLDSENFAILCISDLYLMDKGFIMDAKTGQLISNVAIKDDFYSKIDDETLIKLANLLMDGK